MSLADHFPSLAGENAYWRPGIDISTPPEYDPTYGESNGCSTRTFYECVTCGALVVNPERHADWHDA